MLGIVNDSIPTILIVLNNLFLIIHDYYTTSWCGVHSCPVVVLVVFVSCKTSLEQIGLPQYMIGFKFVEHTATCAQCLLYESLYRLFGISPHSTLHCMATGEHLSGNWKVWIVFIQISLVTIIHMYQP